MESQLYLEKLKTKPHTLKNITFFDHELGCKIIF